MWEECWEPALHRTLTPREAWDKQADETTAWEKGFHTLPWMDRIDFNKTGRMQGWFAMVWGIITPCHSLNFFDQANQALIIFIFCLQFSSNKTC